jgi:hypothetical protein
MNGGPGMLSIDKSEIPGGALLEIYKVDGTYTDCFTTEMPGRITLPEFVFAFYTTLIFKVERLILKWTIAKPSTDAQASQLADGRIQTFAAWYVENKGENELLMCDLQGRTRSWLMVSALNTAGDVKTRLYFGSAVVPVRNPKTGELSLGFAYRTLIGFHRIYSVLLLYFAKSRLMRQRSNDL